MFGMKIGKIVTPYGLFEVGKDGVRKIALNEEVKGAYIVFMEKGSDYREIDIRCKEILVYWK